MLEALRHRTPTPSLERRSARELTLGGRRIKKNRKVLAVVATAMMDPRNVERPREFRIDRHRWEYLQFGWGMHRCLGEPIAAVADSCDHLGAAPRGRAAARGPGRASALGRHVS